jgi:DNA-binding SARP family transcriptional activator
VRGEPLTVLQAAPLLERHAEHLLDGFSLPSDAFDDWLDGARREHASLVARALQALALQWLVDGGDAQAARAAAQRLVAIEPCSESAHACLLAAHAAAGDAAGVELAYFECAALLRRELGIRPSALLEGAYATAVNRCRRRDRAPCSPC